MRINKSDFVFKLIQWNNDETEWEHWQDANYIYKQMVSVG